MGKYKVNETPGIGRYFCTNCKWEKFLEKADDPLPRCNCEKGENAEYERRPPLGRRYAEDDKWTELLLKSIPPEVIGVYLAGTAVTAGILDLPTRNMSLWILWGFCVIFTPIFLKIIQRDKVAPHLNQYFLTTGSFIAWSLTVHGPFTGLVPPALASLIVIVYIGLIAPVVAKVLH